MPDSRALLPLVLLVDDYEDALDMYREYLTFAGYRVITARSGPEAIAVSADDAPDVVFMDLTMAGMNGTETMKRLRRNPSLAKVPIIALSGHASSDDRSHALSEGFDGFLTKPCLPEELMEMVQRVLRTDSQST